MIVEIIRLLIGLLLLVFHKPVADFILAREQAFARMLEGRGVFLPAFPSNRFAHDLYFCIGLLVCIFAMFRMSPWA